MAIGGFCSSCGTYSPGLYTCPVCKRKVCPLCVVPNTKYCKLCKGVKK